MYTPADFRIPARRRRSSRCWSTSAGRTGRCTVQLLSPVPVTGNTRLPGIGCELPSKMPSAIVSSVPRLPGSRSSPSGQPSPAGAADSPSVVWQARTVGLSRPDPDIPHLAYVVPLVLAAMGVAGLRRPDRSAEPWRCTACRSPRRAQLPGPELVLGLLVALVFTKFHGLSVDHAPNMGLR